MARDPDPDRTRTGSGVIGMMMPFEASQMRTEAQRGVEGEEVREEVLRDP